MPSIRSRHSKQMPMPQSAALGQPLTDERKVVTPFASRATATETPCSTCASFPLILMSIERPGRRVPLPRDRRRAAENLIGDKTSRGERSRNAQALVARRDVDIRPPFDLADERELIRGRGPEPCP